MKTKPTSRMKHAGLYIFMAVLMTMSFYSPVSAGSGSYYNATVRINPDLKLKRLSNGTVLIYQKKGNTLELKQQFTEFSADLLMAIYRKQHVDYIITTFAKKYNMSLEECRREVKHMLNVFADWDIIIREDDLANR